MGTRASAMSDLRMRASRSRTVSLVSRFEEPEGRMASRSPACSIECSCSTSLSMSDLMASGAATTTPRSRHAAASLAPKPRANSALSSTDRSNSRVYTFLGRSGHVKHLRRTPRDMSRSAEGHTWVTSRLPSARRSVRSGPITVVLPAPMIICFTRDSPRPRVATKLRTVETCLSLRSRFQTNSKSMKRGSKVRRPPEGAPSASMKWRFATSPAPRSPDACLSWGTRVAPALALASPGAVWSARSTRPSSETAMPTQRLACPTRFARSMVTPSSRETRSKVGGSR
mmetsp:Transcript_68561/g.155039  ORF Transcript_68561/g.155039 Transcript_68561/m.155039 type:complete len:285 (+) Transcript_68561:2643-3497(+)